MLDPARFVKILSNSWVAWQRMPEPRLGRMIQRRIIIDESIDIFSLVDAKLALLFAEYTMLLPKCEKGAHCDKLKRRERAASL